MRTKKSRPRSKVQEVYYSMKRRCTEAYVRAGHPTYAGCFVCEDWQDFSNFVEWFNRNWREGYTLDKDILVPGNREYGPRTCAFVPQEINKLLLKHDSHRGRAPLGVNPDRNGWSASIQRHGKTCHIGYFKTPEEAHAAYLVEKCGHIRKIAWEQLDAGRIEPGVCAGLLRHADIYRRGELVC